MFSKLALSALTVLALTSQASAFEEMVAKINSMKGTWKAKVPTMFNSTEDVAALCGTWMPGHELYTDDSHLHDGPWRAPLGYYHTAPDSYDVMSDHPECSVLGIVRDQSACGSCWAFGSTECFEGSRCIATKEDIEFSTADTAGCCSGLSCGFSMGCNGGQPTSALSWMKNKGVVTGGDFGDIGSGSSCMPYQFAPCAHHVDPTPGYPTCPPEGTYSATCAKSCSEDGYGTDYNDDKFTGAKVNTLNSVSDIQAWLQSTGPVSAAFSVYDDFPTYSSGVYTHQSGSLLGGHAVLIVGWGTEDGQDYWLVKNSWNENWGDGGFFKIARGNNECGIESQCAGISF